MISQYKILILAVLFTLAMQAASDQKLDINELYVRALQFDERYLNEVSQLNLERFDLKSQKSSLYPSITSSVYRTEVDSDTSGPQQSVTSDGRYTSDGYQIQLNQVIYDKALLEKLNSYELLEESIRNKLLNASHELIIRVFDAYWSLQLAEQALREEQNKNDLYKMLLRQASDKSTRGLLSVSEFNQVVSDELEQTYQLTLAQLDLDLARSKLFKLTLYQSKSSGSYQASCQVLSSESIEDDYLNHALEHNVQLKILRDELKAYNKEHESNKSAFYPKVNLSADYSDSDQTGGTFDGSKTERSQIKLSLDWPIYLGGKRYSDAKKSIYKLSSHQRKIEVFILNLKNKVSLMSGRLNIGERNLSTIKKAVEVRNERYQVLKDELKLGSVTQLDLLQEGIKVEQLKTKYVSACKDQVSNQLEFYKLLGTLSTERLEYRQI